MYKIKITYDTGDSFSNDYGCISYLEMLFENEKQGRKCVDWIYEHNEHVTILSGRIYSFNKKEYTEKEQDLKTKPWFCNTNWNGDIVDENDDFVWRHYMMIENDKGELVKLCTFWTGYFENLVEVELVTDTYKKIC